MSSTFHERLWAVQGLTPDCTYKINFGLASIPNFLEQYEIDMDPDYQRGYVWTSEQKQLFVGAAIQNHNAIPPFWFNWYGEKHVSHSEVVDGKQRLNAVLGWLDNQFDAICPCGERFWWHDVDEIGKRGLSMNTIFYMQFTQLDRLGVLKHYLSLNAGGTIHSPKDLDKVRDMIKELES